ncbi:MAG: hypothetical protein HY271_08395 [Deltaproteobacteria bacterium]|nr:hypothetical protein [Deltaproteobacteria bacterium]
MTEDETKECSVEIEMGLIAGRHFLKNWQGPLRHDLTRDHFENWADSAERAVVKLDKSWTEKIQHERSRVMVGGLDSPGHFIPGVHNIMRLLEEARAALAHHG